MTGFALFDDFTDSVLGHHPDFVVGLADAAARAGGTGSARLYCPSSYLRHHQLRPGVVHRPSSAESPNSAGKKVSFSSWASPANVALASSDAEAHGSELFLNCYFDENYPAWPGPRTTMRYVHVLHRPGYFAADAARYAADAGGVAGLVRERAGDSLFVVNTLTGARQAGAFIDPATIIRTGWPTATRAEVDWWYRDNRPPVGDEPYVLSIGSARSDKGINVLLAALADGPRLVILGQQYDGVEERIRQEHARTRVEWESGWVSRQRLSEVIRGASVIVFPYQREFAGYGGASGALAQALAAGKPVIVSDVLAEQVPASPACRVVPTDDVVVLRRAVTEALREVENLHIAASELRDHVEKNHTYEGFVEQVMERCG